MRKNNLFGRTLTFSFILLIFLSIFTISTQATFEVSEQTKIGVIQEIDHDKVIPPPEPNPPTNGDNDNELIKASSEEQEDTNEKELETKEEPEETPDNTIPDEQTEEITSETTTNQQTTNSNSNSGHFYNSHSTSNQNTYQNTENTVETENNKNIIPKNEIYEFTPENYKTTGFYKVKLTPTVNLEDPILTIKKVNQLPENIPNYEGEYNTIIKYLDIKITSDGGQYLTEDKISTLSFNFELEISEIIEKSIDPTDVKLVRYHNGWQELETQTIEGVGEKIYFEATTPGLSTFAIVGKNAEENKSGSEMGPGIPEIPWYILLGIIISGLIVLLVFLVKSKVIYINNEVIEESTPNEKVMPFEY